MIKNKLKESRRSFFINGWLSIGNAFTARWMERKAMTRFPLISSMRIDYSLVLPMFQGTRAIGTTPEARMA